MNVRSLPLLAGLFATTLLLAESTLAVSPGSVLQGRQLFERNWPTGNPALGSDGLGPLFNGQSCVACHHQGGVGGGGDSRFNAKTVGIEQMRITGGNVDDDTIARMVSAFHPGFVQSDGSVINTFTIPHHGGSSAFRQLNSALLANVPSQFSPSGGSADASEVRHSYATPILFNQAIDGRQIVVRARLFQRNTTSLFGAGLIDEVKDKDIEAQFNAQKQHSEISGRPSTLDDGRIGRFGWRGNVASLLDFVDQACANEVGLETKRKPQARDPMNRGYRNPTIDIADKQIRAMKDFIAMLPAPTRRIPESSEERMKAQRGEAVFASVGCAVCHVPNLGPAKGVYSDLLLHDMGKYLIDLNHAKPYVIRRTPVRKYSFTRATTTQTTSPMGAYYGGTTSITRKVESSGTPTGGGRRLNIRNRGPYEFTAPDYPSRLLSIVSLDTKVVSASERTTDFDNASGTGTEKVKERITREDYVRIHYEPTNFNQEWRTPPLWGIADSAPYMHDGRADTLLESIVMHDGESAGTRDRFLNLPLADRHALVAFLETLVAPAAAPKPAL